MVWRCLSLLACLWFASHCVQAWDNTRLGTPLIIDGRLIPYPVFAVYFLPGHRFDVHFKDAVWLAGLIDTMSKLGDFGERIGGLGIYGANSAHGPFVHVDVRGSRARC